MQMYSYRVLILMNLSSLCMYLHNSSAKFVNLADVVSMWTFYEIAGTLIQKHTNKICSTFL